MTYAAERAARVAQLGPVAQDILVLVGKGHGQTAGPREVAMLRPQYSREQIAPAIREIRKVGL